MEGGALVDKKRLRPAQPSQKVKSNVELLNNVTERKKGNKRFKVVAERWGRTAVSEKPKQEKRLWGSNHED